jgi:hypothetical protein
MIFAELCGAACVEGDLLVGVQRGAVFVGIEYASAFWPTMEYGARQPLAAYGFCAFLLVGVVKLAGVALPPVPSVGGRPSAVSFSAELR